MLRILLTAAVLPGLFLAYRINSLDKIEKEPLSLLIKCFFFGVLSIIPALLLEMAGMTLLGSLFYEQSLEYQLLLNFIVIACSEEGSKYFFLKRATWHHPEFNYRFDAVVYAVCTGVGFAVFENINYVLSYGLVTAVLRAVTAVPAHVVFAVFMGHYYGLAKQSYEYDDRPDSLRLRRLALIVPVLLHGFYDFAASSESGAMTAVFWGFLILMYIFAVRQLKRDAGNDMPI